MEAKFYGILENIRSCVNCGSIFTRKNTQLCAACCNSCEKDRALQPFIRQNQQIKFSGYALYDWIPDENNALSALLLSLKGGRPRPVFRHYAEKLLQFRISKGKKLSNNPILIPAAPTTHGAEDHAFALATELSVLLEVELYAPLQKATDTHQRNLNITDRKQMNINTNEKYSKEYLRSRSVIFIDDVVTTGATVFASLEALDFPINYEIWCLAQRASLRPGLWSDIKP
jgi:predicted amidophosphoribosyltransferase